MRGLIGAITIAFVAANCGGNADPANPLTAELAPILADDPDLALTPEEANCAASKIVDALDDPSIEILLDSGRLALNDLAGPDEAIAAYDAYLDCVDVQHQMVDSLLDDGTDETTARCIAESFGEDDLRTILGASALPGGAVDEAAAFALIGSVFEAAQACVTG